MPDVRRVLTGPQIASVFAVVSVIVALTVAALTLPRLPRFSPWPALLGLLPWTIGNRFVGAIGLVMFVAFAATALSVRMALVAGGVGLVAVLAGLIIRQVQPRWIPRHQLPPPGRLLHGLVLSVCYQASIIALLVGTLLATGYHLSPIGVLGAFGASQLAGALPGPNGASPRDGAGGRADRAWHSLGRCPRSRDAQGPARLGSRSPFRGRLPAGSPPGRPQRGTTASRADTRCCHLILRARPWPAVRSGPNRDDGRGKSSDAHSAS